MPETPEPGSGSAGTWFEDCQRSERIQASSVRHIGHGPGGVSLAMP
jgi:hypothetical protein